MNKAAVWAIARKDMEGITANVQVWLPMLVVPLVMVVLLPALMLWALGRYEVQALGNVEPMLRMIDQIPPSGLKSALDALPGVNQRLAYLAVNYVLAGFFLLIPLMTASTISADSFVGEKERGTLESLLFAPVDLLSLFVGKVLSAFIPAVGLSLVAFVAYGLVVNLVGWPLFGRIFFPHPNWLPLMLLVIPMVSLTAILFNVLISARVATFQAAYQLGGLVVLPVMVLIFGQVSGAMLLDTGLLLGIGFGLAAINYILLRQIVRRLQRDRLFTSQAG